MTAHGVVAYINMALPMLQKAVISAGTVAVFVSLAAMIVGLLSTRAALRKTSESVEIKFKVDGKTEVFKITPKQATRLMTALERGSKERPEQRGDSVKTAAAR